MIRLPFSLAAAAAALVLTGCGPPAPALTTDRVTAEQMAALVARPMLLVRRGDMAGAEAALTALLAKARAAHGPRSAQEFDLLMAFAVELYRENRHTEALAWMRRAVEAGARAFGPRHPETAIALQSYADLLDAANGEAPPPAQAIALAEQALAVRREALPPGHPETLAGVQSLAGMKTRAAAANGNRAMAAEAEALIGEALAADGDDAEAAELTPETLRADLATLYAVTGRAGELMRLIEEVEEQWEEPYEPRSAGPVATVWSGIAELLGARRTGGRASKRGGCIHNLGLLWSEQVALLERHGYRREAEVIRSRECPETRGMPAPPAPD